MLGAGVAGRPVQLVGRFVRQEPSMHKDGGGKDKREPTRTYMFAIGSVIAGRGSHPLNMSGHWSHDDKSRENDLHLPHTRALRSWYISLLELFPR